MIAAALATAVALWLSGALVLALCRPTRPRSGAERVAVEVLLGLAVLPALWLVLTAAWGPVSVATGRALLGALCAAGVLARLRVRTTAPTAPEEPRSGVLVAVQALLAAFVVFALFHAASAPMHHFDSTYHFAWKGRVLFGEGLGTAAWTELDGAVGRVMTHPTYPPGVPALGAITACVAGGPDAEATRALWGLFTAGTTLLLYAALRPRGRWAALTAALAWASLPILFYIRLPHEHELSEAIWGLLSGEEWTAPVAERGAGGVPTYARPDGWVMDGAGDLPLAALWFGAALHLLRCLPGTSWARDGADARVAGFLLGGALLAKNEGLGLAGVLVIAFALAWLAGRAERLPALGRLACALSIGALLYLPWVIGQGAIPTVDEGYLDQVRFDVLAARRARAPAIALEFLRTMASFLHWNLLWPLFALVVGWGVARPRRIVASGALFPALLVLGGLALYFLILMVTPWKVTNLFQTAIPERLFLHLAPAAALAAGAMIWPPAGHGESDS